MQPIQQPRLAVSLAIALFASGLAQANSIQLKFEVGVPAIPGYSALEGFRNTIDAGSFQWGVGVGIGSRSGGGRVEVSQPSVSDITWTQHFDPGYNALSQALARGEDSYKSTFSFVRNAGGTAETYLTMTTEQAAISGLSFSSGGGAPSVSASQAFRKFEMGYPGTDAKNPTASLLKTSYNTLTGTTDGASSGTSPEGQGLLTGSARGAAGLYLSLGQGLGGDSVVDGYKNWIELSSMQMGMGVGLSPAISDGFIASRPSISELTVTQSFDRSVIGMLGTLTSGTMIPEARLELVENTDSGAVTTMQLKLQDVLISGLSLSSGGDLPQVSESFNFGAYTQTIWQIGADGRQAGGSVFSYDFATEKSSYSTFKTGDLPDTGASMAELPAGASPIPEPHTWALMAGGIAMLLMLRRRRAS